MTERVFVDTNVLVYARDGGEPEKQPQALAWLRHLWKTGGGVLSFQVLQEFYVTVTHKLDPGMPARTARAEVRDLLSWRPLATDENVLEAAWALQDRYSLSWWDSLIAGAGRVAGCRYILSEDLQDGQDLEGSKVLDPFAHTPESVLGPAP